MKTFSKIISITALIEKRKIRSISFLVMTIMLPVVLNSCQKSSGPPDSFPVNKTIKADLINQGVPTDLADFFAATKLKVNQIDDYNCVYLFTFPNGATRQITVKASPNIIFTPQAGDTSYISPGPAPIYDFKYSSDFKDDGTATINMNYFVANSGLSLSGSNSTLLETGNKSSRSMKMAPAVSGSEGTGIAWQEIWNKGSDYTIGSVLEAFKEEGKVQAGIGSLYALASALNDISTAMQIRQENLGWLAELDELEKCASNPTNLVAKSDPNYVPNAVKFVQDSRTDLKEVNAVRYLNLMTEKFADLNPVTGAIAVGLKQGFAWNEQTLKDISENSIMHDVRNYIVPCDNTPMKGNIDVVHDCTDGGPTGSTRTFWHIQTSVTWIYDPMKADYYSMGNYTFDYKQTISGAGSSCDINRSSAGDLGPSGMLVVISDPLAQETLGFGYSAVGNLDARVAMYSSCQGINPATQSWTVVWLPLIKAYAHGGAYYGETIDSCSSGTGYEKVKWSFVVPKH